MKRSATLVLSLAIALSIGTYAWGGTKKGVQSMGTDDLIKTAQGGAPPHISMNAAVIVPDGTGGFKTLKEGTNGFTCVPDISGQEKPDPFCGDGQATEWIMSAIKKDPRPANSGPGIGYMAKGGFHWEKDGAVVMSDTMGAKMVKEPPHWMILWPGSAGISAFQTMPGKFGSYVMYEGTPFAHIMVYQDPNKMMPAGPSMMK